MGGVVLEKDAVIYVMPQDLWEFFLSNTEYLTNNDVLIAEDKASKCEIYLTEYDNAALIGVCKDGSCIKEEFCFSKADAAATLEEIYAEYMMPTQEGDDASGKTVDDLCEEQEIYISTAFDEFLRVVCEQDEDFLGDDYDSEVREELLNDVLEIIGRKYGYPVYRPTIYEDDDGYMIFDEYPYCNEDDDF